MEAASAALAPDSARTDPGHRDESIICVTVEGKVVSWSHGAERLYGYTEAEMVGRSLAPIYPRDRLDEGKRLVRALTSGLRIEEYETVRIHKDGHEIAVIVSFYPVHDRRGMPVGFVGAARSAATPPDTRTAAPPPAAADLEARILAAAAGLQARLRARERFAGRLLQVQDEERRRLGRDLHDSTGQLLVALNMNLARLATLCGDANPDIVQTIVDSRALADQCTSEIRTISYLLHPPLLDEAGLDSAIRWYLDGYSKRSGIRADVRIQPAFPRLSYQAETAIFRVLQECLTNVHRHAQSPVVRVRLRHAAGVAALSVEDRGRGFTIDPDSAGGGEIGVGITGMRERLRQLGGQLLIASGPRGTTVRAHLPCRTRRSRAASGPTTKGSA